MAIKLICVHPLHGYARGQEVTDSATVSAILADHREAHFVKVAAPDAPAEPDAEAPPSPLPEPTE